MDSIVRVPPIYLSLMAPNGTLLCIHRDPAQLNLLRENGYELLMAASGSDGLRLLMSRAVDAIVLDHHLGRLDAAAVAAEIKKAKPQLPVIMVADDLEVPKGTLKSVDALVTRSDGPHFLWATVHFVLNVKPTQGKERTLSSEPKAHLRRSGKSRELGEAGNHPQSGTARPTITANETPFSLGEWRQIRTGRVKF